MSAFLPCRKLKETLTRLNEERDGKKRTISRQEKVCSGSSIVFFLMLFDSSLHRRLDLLVTGPSVLLLLLLLRLLMNGVANQLFLALCIHRTDSSSAC